MGKFPLKEQRRVLLRMFLGVCLRVDWFCLQRAGAGFQQQHGLQLAASWDETHPLGGASASQHTVYGRSLLRHFCFLAAMYGNNVSNITNTTTMSRTLLKVMFPFLFSDNNISPDSCQCRISLFLRHQRRLSLSLGT